jgi:hypothetical protein
MLLGGEIEVLAIVGGVLALMTLILVFTREVKGVPPLAP